MTNNYSLQAHDTLLSHGNWRQLVLHDFDDRSDLQIEAYAASGDCFSMIANELDQVVLSLQPGSNERFELLRMIEVLMYLQDHHKIIRKS